MRNLSALLVVFCLASTAQAGSCKWLGGYFTSAPIELGLPALIPWKQADFDDRSAVITAGKPTRATIYSDFLAAEPNLTVEKESAQLRQLKTLMTHPLDGLVVEKTIVPVFAKDRGMLYVRRSFTEWIRWPERKTLAIRWFMDTIGTSTIPPYPRAPGSVDFIFLLVKRSALIQDPFLLAFRPQWFDFFKRSVDVGYEHIDVGGDRIRYEDILAIYFMTRSNPKSSE